MRIFLAILAIPSGGIAILMAVATFTEGGSDLQMIGAGVFLTVFVVCLTGACVIGHLEKRGPSQ